MPEEQKKKEEQQPEVELPRLLKGVKDGPSQDQIEKWKAVHGEVFVSGFSEEELFVFRPVTRGEHISMQETIRAKQLTEWQAEELLLQACVLWPSGTDWSQCKGGTATTLSNQIMVNSNFIGQDVAMMLVAKL
jgi:hypothetical protein